MDESDIGQQWRGFRRPFQGSPQQGTLFDKRGVDRAPDNSPGAVRQRRRQQLVGAMPKTWAGATLPEHGEAAAKIEQRAAPLLSTYEDPEEPWRRENVLQQMASHSAGKGLRAEMGKRLADETTVTPDHLEGIDRIDVGQTPQGLGEGRFMWPTFHPEAAAHYHQSANGPRIQAPRPMDTGTLTHEIGHHVSRFHEQNPAGPREAPGRSGLNVDLAEEGRADAFALEHAGDKRSHTYASLDAEQGLLSSGRFENFQSPYRIARERAGQPLRDWERSEQQPPRPRGMEDPSAPKEYRQSEVFTTEQAELGLPYMGLDLDVNVYRPNPVLDRGNRPIGFDVPASNAGAGVYQVEGGTLSPRDDTGYYWKTREGEERSMANYIVEDGVTVDNLEKHLRKDR